MTNQDRDKAWGFTLFGDDIRAELGGKLSLMGLYQSDMIFPGSINFPITISKFILLVMYYEVVGAVDGDINLRVTFGPKNESIIEMPVLRKDLDNLATNVGNEESSEDSERIFHIRLPLVLSPFTIAGTGRLRVRAHYGNGTVLKLGSIAIKQLPDEEFKAITGFPVVPQQPS